MPEAGIGEKIMWGVVIVLAVGYLTGTWLNRRRSQTIGYWLQSGLRGLGGVTSWKWVGTMSSGAQVTVANANPPFRQLQLTYLLLTRELWPLWGIELLRGKRDLLIVRAALQSEPQQEFEVVPWRGKLRRALDRAAGSHPWHWQEMPAGLGMATRSDAQAALGEKVRPFLERYGRFVQRLSLRQRQPHLILFMHLSGLEEMPAREFLEAVRRVVGGQD
jgi:hypothetical protein